MAVAAPRAHFDHHQHVAVTHDQVKLPVAAAVVGGEPFQAAGFKVSAGQPFGLGTLARAGAGAA